MGFTVSSEGFRMCIPTGISSPVGSEQQPTFLTHAASRRHPQAPWWQVSLSATVLLSPRWGRRDDPGPLSPLDHMASLCSLPSCSGVGLFLMVVVIVPKVSPLSLCPGFPARG